MTRQSKWIGSAAVLTAVALGAGALSAAAPVAAADDLAARARKLHQQAIVVDSHVDAPDALSRKWADVAQRGATDHFDIPRAREGGLTAPFFAIYVAASYAEKGGAARRALDLIDLTRRIVDAHPADMAAAASVADIRRAKKEGRIAVLMGIEGGHAIEDSLGALRLFHALGVRYMTLTHINSNHWADSSGPFFMPDFNPADSRLHGGLSDFGRAVVREMNRLGMMVDVSHVSDETIDDVLAASRAPVFASHSSCRAIADMPRNLTDDQIRRIAEKGGVVMINIGSYFLDPKSIEAYRADTARLQPEYDRIKKEFPDDAPARMEAWGKVRETEPKHRTGWTTAVDHIEHVLKIGGSQAAGLGTDFDGISDPPEGLDDVSMLPRITEELLRRGHPPDEVRGVLGENFLRYFAKVEAVARSLASEPPATDTISPAK